MKSVASLLTLLCFVPALSLAEPPSLAPVEPSTLAATLTPPEVAAKGYLLVSHPSGQVLAEFNADERLERFSTPLMRSLRFRHPWLQINLATCFVAARLTVSGASLCDQTIWSTSRTKRSLRPVFAPACS